VRRSASAALNASLRKSYFTITVSRQSRVDEWLAEPMRWAPLSGPGPLTSSRNAIVWLLDSVVAIESGRAGTEVPLQGVNGSRRRTYFDHKTTMRTTTAAQSHWRTTLTGTGLPVDYTDVPCNWKFCSGRRSVCDELDQYLSGVRLERRQRFTDTTHGPRPLPTWKGQGRRHTGTSAVSNAYGVRGLHATLVPIGYHWLTLSQCRFAVKRLKVK